MFWIMLGYTMFCKKHELRKYGICHDIFKNELYFVQSNVYYNMYNLVRNTIQTVIGLEVGNSTQASDGSLCLKRWESVSPKYLSASVAFCLSTQWSQVANSFTQFYPCTTIFSTPLVSKSRLLDQPEIVFRKKKHTTF